MTARWPSSPSTETPRPARAILGAGQFSKQHGVNEAEYATFVADHFQGQGLGTELLRRLIQVGRDEKIARITGEILLENIAMQRICQKLGFQLTHAIGEGNVKAVLDL